MEKVMTDKEKKSEYNKRYYESHKADILESRKGKVRKPVVVDVEAHRKAAREYYHRKKASMTPEEREAMNAKRRVKRKQNLEGEVNEEVSTVKNGQKHAIG